MSKRVSIILPEEMESRPSRPSMTRSKSSLKKSSTTHLKVPNTLELTSSDMSTSHGTFSSPRTASSDPMSPCCTRSKRQGTSSDLPSPFSSRSNTSQRTSSSCNYFRDPTNTTPQQNSGTSRKGWLSMKASIADFLENTIGVVGAGSATSIINFLSHFSGEGHNPSLASDPIPTESSAHAIPKPEPVTLFRREKAKDASSDAGSTAALPSSPSPRPSVATVKKLPSVEVLYKSSSKSLASVKKRSSSKSRQKLPRLAFTMVSSKGALNIPEETTKGATDPCSTTKSPSEAAGSGATYDEHCSCCHCKHMRCAVKQAEFLASDEGKRRMQMKMAANDIFMDLAVMGTVRERFLSDLNGTSPEQPSRLASFPIAITGARRLDAGSLSLEWFVHDYSDIGHYEIYADNVLSRSIYNPRTLRTVLLDIDVSKPHKLRMRPIPVQGRGPGAQPVDRLVQQLRGGGLARMTGGTLCKCLLQQETTSDGACRSLIAFWTESEFHYLPAESTRSEANVPE